MPRKYFPISIVFLSVISFNCDLIDSKDPLPNQIVITVDKSEYFFVSNYQNDSILIYLYNGSDDAVYSWYPSYTQLLTDTGWILKGMPDGGILKTILPGQSDVFPYSIVVRPGYENLFPEGLYRFVCEINVDTVGPIKTFVTVPSNSFFMKYLK